jgi:anti-sigma B factor antagonist
MTAAAANMSVWVGERVVCFKIGGRANFTASVDFKAAINNLCRKGYCRFVLDLTDCLLLDSTFLGVLSGIGLRFSAPPHDGAPAAILELHNPNARVSDLLENLGIAHLFQVSAGLPVSVEHLVCIEQTPASPDRRIITETCLDAHRTLMELNRANIPKFKDVAQFLAEDLKKLEAQASARPKPEAAG